MFVYFMNLQKNILILATHGTYFIPWYLKIFLTSYFKKYNYRLLKNFSDFATSYLLEDISLDNKIICHFSRALWDPNRNRDALDIFRGNDFNDIKIWKFNFPSIFKEFLLRKYYDNYHNNILKKIDLIEKKYKNIIIIDIHDTWNYLLWVDKKDDRKRSESFPMINLGNCDNKSSSKVFMDNLSELIESEFWFTPAINTPYKWWYVTQKYWLNHVNRECVQIEFWRYLYMNEQTQELDNEALEDIKNKFYSVIKKLK